MKNLVVLYIGIVGQESRSMKYLLSQKSVSVESVISSAFDLRSMAPANKREKRFAQEMQEISLPGIIDMRNWALFPFKHLLKSYAGKDCLSIHGMKCFDKTRQYFLSMDVMDCKKQELLLCIECLELSSSISDEARRIMANDDGFMDQLFIVHCQSRGESCIFLRTLYPWHNARRSGRWSKTSCHACLPELNPRRREPLSSTLKETQLCQGNCHWRVSLCCIRASRARTGRRLYAFGRLVGQSLGVLPYSESLNGIHECAPTSFSPIHASQNAKSQYTARPAPRVSLAAARLVSKCSSIWQGTFCLKH